MDQGADVVAICITCCTVTGLIFGIAGIMFGRTWALKWAGPSTKSPYDGTCDDEAFVEPGASLEIGKAPTVRHRGNAVSSQKGVSFIF